MNKNMFDNNLKVGNPHKLEILLTKVFAKKFVSIDMGSEKNDCTVVTHTRRLNGKIYIIKQHITQDTPDFSYKTRVEFPSSTDSWGKITHSVIYGYRKTVWNRFLKSIGVEPKYKVLSFESSSDGES